MNKRYMNNGGQSALGQLGNQRQQQLDPPPQEYMPQQPLRQPRYRQPAPQRQYRDATTSGDGLETMGGLGEKEQRRQKWLQKKRNKRRGLRQLNMGGGTWN